MQQLCLSELCLNASQVWIFSVSFEWYALSILIIGFNTPSGHDSVWFIQFRRARHGFLLVEDDQHF